LAQAVLAPVALPSPAAKLGAMAPPGPVLAAPSVHQLRTPNCSAGASDAEQDSAPWMSLPMRRRVSRQSQSGDGMQVPPPVSVVDGSRFAALLSEETDDVAHNSESEAERADAIGKDAVDELVPRENKCLIKSQMLPKPRFKCCRAKLSRRKSDNNPSLDSLSKMTDADWGCDADATLAAAASSDATLPVAESCRARETVRHCPASESTASPAVALAFASNILALMAGDPAAAHPAKQGEIGASGRGRWQQASALHRGRKDHGGRQPTSAALRRQPMTAAVRRQNGR